MSNWSRAKDAWIARECEGLEVSDRYGSEWHEMRSGRPWKPVDSYSTDPAAAIRAAEAWRKKRGDRCGWEVGHGDTPVANTFYWSTEKDMFRKEYQDHISAETPAAALAQALYRATGGPA